MSDLYAAMRADVGQLLAELGQLVTYQRDVVVTDLVEGTSSPTSSLVQQLPTATLPVKDTAVHYADLDMRPIEGSNALAEVKFAIISTVGVEFIPTRGDKAFFGSKAWTVLSTTAINLDGENDVVYLAGLQA